MPSAEQFMTTPLLLTIGYETATPAKFLEVLQAAGVDLLVDVRAAARSRRPGFAKTRLAANLEEAGIRYLHLRDLGTPAEGRAAARGGRHEEMQRIFREQLKTPAAQARLQSLVTLIRSGERVCLLCLETNPEHCHRSLVAEAVVARMRVRVSHLHVDE